MGIAVIAEGKPMQNSMEQKPISADLLANAHKRGDPAMEMTSWARESTGSEPGNGAETARVVCESTDSEGADKQTKYCIVLPPTAPTATAAVLQDVVYRHWRQQLPLGFSVCNACHLWVCKACFLSMFCRTAIIAGAVIRAVFSR